MVYFRGYFVIQQRFASLLFSRPFDTLYTYLIPDQIEALKQGDFVKAPLGRGQEIGIVWEISDQKPDIAKLKPILEKLDLPALDASLRQIIDWVSHYYLCPKGLALKLAIPSKEALTYAPQETLYSLKGQFESLKKTKEREKLIAFLSKNPDQNLTTILEKTGISRSVFNGALNLGMLESKEIKKSFLEELSYTYSPPLLSKSQHDAAHFLKEQTQKQCYSSILLDGVTGSGKTEVYFEAIAEALRLQKQSLILMPEIALTSQWLHRFEKRFGEKPILWHSSLTPKTRREHWLSCLEGKAKIVVGARSALFLPLSKLGLIIVDEEHETSYKQEEGVKYHARDTSIMRAKFAQCPIILASATPSLETLHNVETKGYHHLKLPNRFGNATFPEVTIIDLKQKALAKQNWISDQLLLALKTNIERKEQSLLYLNRRGYAPLKLCCKCGYRVKCRQCSTWLVEHSKKQVLICHYCGYQEQIPHLCPECQNQDSFISCGPGVERIAEEVYKHFPDAKVAIMSSDHTSKWSEIESIVKRLEEGEIDILIGTQMVTKGYHFPKLTLVGIIDGDNGLSGSDPRIAERTYQLLHQVGGRAGRADLKGRVLIQTYVPEQPIMQALLSENRKDFLDEECSARENWDLPPYTRLVAILLEGRNQKEVLEIAQHIALNAPPIEGIEILGPVEAPLPFIRGKYRMRILLKIKQNVSAQKYMKVLKDYFPKKSSTNIEIDIDPFQFL